MNERMKKGRELSNEELIKRCDNWIKSLCDTGGKSWCLRVPVEYDRDPDMLFTELILRYEATLSKSSLKDSDDASASENCNDEPPPRKS